MVMKNSQSLTSIVNGDVKHKGYRMNQTQILQDLNALPADAQELVAGLVAFLSREHQPSKSSRKENAVSLTDEKFIGLWIDRDDMQDSSAYVRNLRNSDWS